MEKIKILHLINSSAVGGGPKHVQLLIRGMDGRRFENIVGCSDDGPMVAVFKEMDVEVSVIDFVDGFHPEMGRMRLWILVSDVLSVISSQKVDLVHAHGTRTGIYGGIAARIAGIRCIYTVHALSVSSKRSALGKILCWFIERTCCFLVDFVISVSEANRQIMVKWKIVRQDKIQTIRNGIDIDELTPDLIGGDFLPSGDFADGRAVVGTVGRLVPQKGQEYFIRAAKMVLDVYPGVEFLVVGEGPLEGRLKGIAVELKIDDKVKFAGTRKDIADVLRKMDIVVMPSLWEGLPYVALEALGAGKAVVASDVGGIREVVEDERTGLLVKPKDVKGLADALIGLLKDRDRINILGTGGRNAVSERFDVCDAIEGTVGVYERVLEL